MANICSNSYHFIFNDGEKAKKFLNFVNTSDLLYKFGNSKYKEVVYVHEIEYTPISDWAL